AITDQNFKQELFSPGRHFVFIYDSGIFDNISEDLDAINYPQDLEGYVKRYPHRTSSGATISYCNVATTPAFKQHEGLTPFNLEPLLVGYFDGEIQYSQSFANWAYTLPELIEALNGISGHTLISQISLKELLRLDDGFYHYFNQMTEFNKANNSATTDDSNGGSSTDEGGNNDTYTDAPSSERSLTIKRHKQINAIKHGQFKSAKPFEKKEPVRPAKSAH
ncbi:MAG: hypothetical protein ACRD3W_06725, partial [Terriglobales bacterium]